MPADYGGPCPSTPYAMNRRFLQLAQFMRDPERYIRRHAARIAKRAGIDLSNPLAAHGSTDATLRVAAHHEAAGVASPRSQSLNTLKQLTLMVSSTRSVRPSNHEGELRCQLHARGPPQPTSSPIHSHALSASARLGSLPLACGGQQAYAHAP